MQKDICQEIIDNDVDRCSQLLIDHPELLNASWKDDHYNIWFPLHYACSLDCVDIVAVILALPQVNVNLKNSDSETPLYTTCLYNSIATVYLLLSDPRVNVTEVDSLGITPLYVPAARGHLQVIKLYLAMTADTFSWLDCVTTPGVTVRRQVEPCQLDRCWSDVENAAKTFSHRHTLNNGFTTTLDVQPIWKKIIDLVANFRARPQQTRCELRLELGLAERFTTDLFALVIFTSDGLLQIRPDNSVVVASDIKTIDDSQTINSSDHEHTSDRTRDAASRRFFAISQQLPIELQMTLCWYVNGLPKTNITSQSAESSFRRLAALQLL